METLRIAIPLKDFWPERERLQPWRYMCALAEALREDGHEVTIVTHKFPRSDWRGIPIVHRGSSRSIYNPRFLADVLSDLKTDGTFISVSSQFMLSAKKPHPHGRRRRSPAVGIVLGPLYGTRQLAKRMLNPLLIPDIAIDIPHLASWFSRKCGSWTDSGEYLDHLTFVWRGDMAAAVSAGVNQTACSVYPHPFDPFFLNWNKNQGPAGIMSQLPPAQKRVVFAGPEEFSRGLHQTMALADRISSNLPTQVLVLVRDFSHQSPVITTKMHGRHSCVVVRGVLSKEEIRDAFGSATLGLFPYLFVRSAFPLVLLEAVATGLIVMTSPVYPLTELAEETGMQFVNPNDLQSIAGNIDTLLNDEERMAQIRRKNEAWIRRTPTWGEMAKTLVGKLKVVGEESA